MHQKQAHDRAAAKKTRSYNFCILNEAIHEEILSFLHFRRDMITGDRVTRITIFKLEYVSDNIYLLS
ncbi:hypothetical protein GQ600_431 [Phytophthora cactorum]|nr:hypothetical protein GQ600_431 [Phytophthora cactorum]